MSTYLTDARKISEYIAKNGDEAIMMKMTADGENLIITFQANENRSFFSKIGLKNKAWSTYTAKMNIKKNLRTDMTPMTITKFEKIIIIFSPSSRGAYDKLFCQFHNDSDNVNQTKLKEMLAHIFNPRVNNFEPTSLKVNGSGEFLGHEDRFPSDVPWGYEQQAHYYTNFTAEIEIR